MKKLLTVCVLCCLMATGAFARNYENRKIVVAGQGGVFVPTEDYMDFDSKVGAFGIIDGQFFFNDYIGVGTYAMWSGYRTEDVTVAGVEYERDITSGMFGVSVIGRFPINKMDFYALAGVSYVYNDYEIESETAGVTTTRSQDDNGLAYRAEIGARYYVWRTLSVGGSFGYIVNEMDVKDLSGVKHTEKMNGFYGGIGAAWSF